MSRRERFWLTAAIVTALALIVWFLMQDNQRAEAQAPVPTASAAPEPLPGHHPRLVPVMVVAKPPPRAVVKPAHKIVRPKAPKPRAIAVSSSVSAFLKCIAWKESRGSYTAQNSTSSASGKYQFIRSTWISYSQMAGYPGWGAAKYAPPAVQDAVAVWVVVHLGRYPWRGDNC